MSNIFSMSYIIEWFDSSPDSCDYQWRVSIFDDGSVQYRVYCYDNGINITKNYHLEQNELNEIMNLVSKTFYSCSDFNNNETSDYNYYEIIEQNKFLIDDYWNYNSEEVKHHSNITEKYLLNVDESQIEVSFKYKKQCISSKVFCIKAPFTLIAKEISKIIQKQFPEVDAVF